jgi:DNA-binding MarR family transcriptional regulator
MEPPASGPGLAWLSRPEQEAWRLMMSVYGRMIGRLDGELQEVHDISLRDYQVLLQLSEAEGYALRMAELAERLAVSPSGLTRRLDGLVRDGLVIRQACESDRRGTLAVLSAEGWIALETAAPTHLAGVRRYVFDALGREQLRQLTAGLRSISAALDRTTGPLGRP